MKLALSRVGPEGTGLPRNVLRKGKFESGLSWIHTGNSPVMRSPGLARSPMTPCRAGGGVRCDSSLRHRIASGEAICDQATRTGWFSGLKPRCVSVRCSTALPRHTLRMGAAVKGRGRRLSYAPMTHATQNTRP